MLWLRRSHFKTNQLNAAFNYIAEHDARLCSQFLCAREDNGGTRSGQWCLCLDIGRYYHYNNHYLCNINNSDLMIKARELKIRTKARRRKERKRCKREEKGEMALMVLTVSWTWWGRGTGSKMRRGGFFTLSTIRPSPLFSLFLFLPLNTPLSTIHFRDMWVCVCERVVLP